MNTIDIIREISRKECDKKKIAEAVIQQPELLSQVISGLADGKASIAYGCGKVLCLISEKAPRILYPFFDVFVWLLDSSKNITKWEGIYIIGNLGAVDSENRIDGVLVKYLAPITGNVMITAANVISGAGKIARDRPHLSDRIATEILKVEHARYQTDECRNVALGHAIEAFDKFLDHLSDQELVIALVKRQTANTRKNTRTRAEKFLNKHLS